MLILKKWINYQTTVFFVCFCIRFAFLFALNYFFMLSIWTYFSLHIFLDAEKVLLELSVLSTFPKNYSSFSFSFSFSFYFYYSPSHWILNLVILALSTSTVLDKFCTNSFASIFFLSSSDIFLSIITCT